MSAFCGAGSRSVITKGHLVAPLSLAGRSPCGVPCARLAQKSPVFRAAAVTFIQKYAVILALDLTPVAQVRTHVMCLSVRPCSGARRTCACAKEARRYWLASTYYPILDLNGKAYRVLQFSTDVTGQKLASADSAGQVAAISKSQAVIEFRYERSLPPTRISLTRGASW